MISIQQALTEHLKAKGQNPRRFAVEHDLAYPAVLALANRGALPRSPELRERLRSLLGIDAKAWARMVLAAQGSDAPAEGEQTLQQLVVEALVAERMNEQALSKLTGVPYQTLMGLTRRGAVPRADTLRQIADGLNLTADQIAAAVAVSRAQRADDEDDEHPTTDMAAPPEPEPAARPATGSVYKERAATLPERIAGAVTRAEVSVASWAKEHGLPYLSLTRVLSTGKPPSDEDLLGRIQAALGLSASDFADSLAATAETPEPVKPHQAHTAADNPLQAALLKVMEQRHLTVKAFADLAGLSALTATRLLKDGELPGRASTHDKLRTLLGLGVVEYEQLVDRSRQAIAKAGGNAGLAESGEVPGPVETVTSEELIELIRRLSPGQRLAAQKWLRTLLGD